MSTRNRYRTWDYGGEEHFLRISPKGIMLEIVFKQDGLRGDLLQIYQTWPLNPLNPESLAKSKEVCSKKDFEAAQKRAIKMIKG